MFAIFSRCSIFSALAMQARAHRGWSEVVLFFSSHLGKMMMLTTTFHLGVRSVISSFFLCWRDYFKMCIDPGLENLDVHRKERALWIRILCLGSISGELERLLHRATLMKTESKVKVHEKWIHSISERIPSCAIWVKLACGMRRGSLGLWNQNGLPCLWKIPSMVESTYMHCVKISNCSYWKSEKIFTDQKYLLW